MIIVIGLCLVIGSIIITYTDSLNGNEKGTGDAANNATTGIRASATPQPTPDINISVTPSPGLNTTISNATPPATRASPEVKSAKLVEVGTNNDTYHPGDTASVYATIENTGTVTINSARVTVRVEKHFPNIGYVEVECPTAMLNDLNISPGRAGRGKYSVTIPVDYQGVSTTGEYRFTVFVMVWDTNIGEVEKHITVQ